MRVETLAVGTELLLGDIVNGNAAWLGQQLTAHGFDVVAGVVVGDNIERIATAVRDGLVRSDALVITGGLGPTQDDLTREALALVAGVGLHRQRELVDALLARYAAAGRVMPDSNLRQADVPAGGTALPNARGSAPGLRIETLGGVVYALPGVPREMEAMFTEQVLPDLIVRAGGAAAIVSRVLHTLGLWESKVAELLGDLDDRLGADHRDDPTTPTLAYLAGGGEVRVRITAKAATAAEAKSRIEPVEAEVRRLLGAAVYGVDRDTLDGVVHRLLLERGESVAVAESLTGGLLGARLTAVPGSSETFRGGITAYATEVKAALLGVPAAVLANDGAVSAQAAEAMARGARDALGATYGLALTGVAGPDRQEGKPAGLVYAAIATPLRVVARELRLPGDRAQVRQFASAVAVDLLRRELTGLLADAPEEGR